MNFSVPSCLSDLSSGVIFIVSEVHLLEVLSRWAPIFCWSECLHLGMGWRRLCSLIGLWWESKSLPQGHFRSRSQLHWGFPLLWSQCFPQYLFSAVWPPDPVNSGDSSKPPSLVLQAPYLPHLTRSGLLQTQHDTCLSADPRPFPHLHLLGRH